MFEMKILVKTITLLAILSMVGCATLTLESKLNKPVSMTKERGTQVKTFVMQKQAIWLFWGLIPISVPNIDDVVGAEVADHGGVQNLKIKTEYTLLNWFLGAVTQGVIYSQTVTIEGQVYD